MRVLGLFLGLFLASTLSASPVKFPHLADDLIAGNVAHAQTHIAKDAVISTMWNGKPVSVAVADFVAQFKGCKKVRFGKDKLFNSGETIIVLNCGDSYDFDIKTGDRSEGITRVKYYAEALAPLPPPAKVSN